MASTKKSGTNFTLVHHAEPRIRPNARRMSTPPPMRTHADTPWPTASPRMIGGSGCAREVVLHPAFAEANRGSRRSADLHSGRTTSHIRQNNLSRTTPTRSETTGRTDCPAAVASWETRGAPANQSPHHCHIPTKSIFRTEHSHPVDTGFHGRPRGQQRLSLFLPANALRFRSAPRAWPERS